jgi:hypothetical protein
VVGRFLEASVLCVRWLHLGSGSVCLPSSTSSGVAPLSVAFAAVRPLPCFFPSCWLLCGSPGALLASSRLSGSGVLLCDGCGDGGDRLSCFASSYWLLCGSSGALLASARLFDSGAPLCDDFGGGRGRFYSFFFGFDVGTPFRRAFSGFGVGRLYTSFSVLISASCGVYLYICSILAATFCTFGVGFLGVFDLRS